MKDYNEEVKSFDPDEVELKSDELSFGQALELIQDGYKVCRAGWNGKGIYIWYVPPIYIAEGMVNNKTAKFVPTGDLRIGGYLAIYTAQGTMEMGYRPTSMDMLAKDWMEV